MTTKQKSPRRYPKSRRRPKVGLTEAKRRLREQDAREAERKAKEIADAVRKQELAAWREYRGIMVAEHGEHYMVTIVATDDGSRQSFRTMSGKAVSTKQGETVISFAQGLFGLSGWWIKKISQTHYVVMAKQGAVIPHANREYATI